MLIFRDGPGSELCKRSIPTVREGLEQESDPFISAGLPVAKAQIPNPRSKAGKVQRCVVVQTL